MPKDRIAYFYDNDYETFYFGAEHPMKPHRLAMTHHLVLGYGLHEKMQVFKPRPALPVEIAQFHSNEYVDFLSRISPDNQEAFGDEIDRYLSEDCPVFDGLFPFCQLYAGASIEGAKKLNHGLVDIAINWGGGLHHAKKNGASGFCYVNDLVLAIVEMLKYNARVLYIDIDVHHGDGVEEAFYLSDRVMTVSFHKFGPRKDEPLQPFFPGTGDIADMGALNGRGYSVNVPLKDGTSDETFHSLFKPIMTRIMEVFRPSSIVLQCGADSLAHDRLGCFNLSLKGHGEAVRFMKSFNVPMLVTGGGGYTKKNVARCWTYETSILTDSPVSEHLPKTAYWEYFSPDHSINVPPQKDREEFSKDDNTRADIDKIKKEVFESLRQLACAPSVQMHEVPSDMRTPRFEAVTCDEAPLEERLGLYGRQHNFWPVPPM